MLERYTTILNTIKEICPTAHIAGGAVRDSLLERPIKDVDLFLDVGYTDEAAALMRSQFGFVKVGEWKSYEMFSDPAVARVAKFEKADETIPVCLIGLMPLALGLRGMQANLERFDFGICMAAWDGNEVYTAYQYKRDVEQKTFTLRRADDQQQFNYSRSRFDKMTADRYAGWRLVVPQEFGALEREYTFRKNFYFDDEAGGFVFRDCGPQLLTPKAR